MRVREYLISFYLFRFRDSHSMSLYPWPFPLYSYPLLSLFVRLQSPAADPTPPMGICELRLGSVSRAGGVSVDRSGRASRTQVLPPNPPVAPTTRRPPSARGCCQWHNAPIWPLSGPRRAGGVRPGGEEQEESSELTLAVSGQTSAPPW